MNNKSKFLVNQFMPKISTVAVKRNRMATNSEDIEKVMSISDHLLPEVERFDLKKKNKKKLKIGAM